MTRVLILPFIKKYQAAIQMVKHFPPDIEVEIFPEWWTRSVGPLPSFRMLRKLTEFDPAVIFTDNPIYSTWYAKLYRTLKRKNVRLVSRLHGDPWVELFDELSRTIASLRSIPPSKALYILLRNPYLYFLTERTLITSDRIVTVCNWLKRRVQSHLRTKQVEVAYQAIDTSSLFDDGEYVFVGPRSKFYKDHQIRALGEDAEDDNWEAQIFLRVQWRDTDLHYDVGEVEVEYIVVTSVLDEGDYDSLSIEEVTRRFEFN